MQYRHRKYYRGRLGLVGRGLGDNILQVFVEVLVGVVGVEHQRLVAHVAWGEPARILALYLFVCVCVFVSLSPLLSPTYHHDCRIYMSLQYSMY